MFEINIVIDYFKTIDFPPWILDEGNFYPSRMFFFFLIYEVKGSFAILLLDDTIEMLVQWEREII